MSVWEDLHKRGIGEATREEELVMREIPYAELEKMLYQGIVHFQYKKKGTKKNPDGDIRDAWGTKMKDAIDSVPHGGYCPPKEAGYTIYFDLEKKDWRAFLSDRLVGVCPKIYTLDEFESLTPEDKGM